MRTFFASDVHLRPDRPDRGARLARWVAGMAPGADRLVLVGDLCDFWFASRQRRGLDLPCDGLRALADFTRRGGELITLPGNHDAWLGPYYEQALGARFVASGHVEMTSGDLRILATHGHQLGARSPWKQVMEARVFLAAFGSLPSSLACRLEDLLDRTNEAQQGRHIQRYLDLYRRCVAPLADRFDLVVLGHVHHALDDRAMRPRMVVLGDWKFRTCFLRVEGGAAEHVVVEGDREA